VFNEATDFVLRWRSLLTTAFFFGCRFRFALRGDDFDFIDYNCHFTTLLVEEVGPIKS
jgi:hypothetical protein